MGGTATQYSLFAQDEYQLNSRLTLSYGLRWQILPGFQEDGGNLANFDQRNNSIVVPNALAGYLAKPKHHPSNVAFQQSFNACNLGYTALPCTNYVTASQDHLPQSLRNTYKGNFQPRVSIAYRPFNDTKTVIRARLRYLHHDQSGAALLQQQRQPDVEPAQLRQCQHGRTEYATDTVPQHGACQHTACRSEEAAWTRESIRTSAIRSPTSGT